MRILFLGTPDFAIPSLAALVNAPAHTVIGVVTQPDKPKGRGYTLCPPPVKRFAEEHAIPVYQPATLRDEAFAALLRELSPELLVVVAYGKILPKSVLEFPPYGCINVHGSLLPAYRGAAPMQRAILDGCTVTGVTTMYMAEGLDTGDMLDRATLPIGDADNFETVHDGLAKLGADTLLLTLSKLEKGKAVRIPQDDTLSTYAAKIEKEDCLLDFSHPAHAVHNRIRALSPIPLSYTRLHGKMLKILSAYVESEDSVPAPAGTVVSAEGDHFSIACGKGVLAVTAVLPEGKGKMSAADYLRGRKLNRGDRLGE